MSIHRILRVEFPHNLPPPNSNGDIKQLQGQVAVLQAQQADTTAKADLLASRVDVLAFAYANLSERLTALENPPESELPPDPPPPIPDPPFPPSTSLVPTECVTTWAPGVTAPGIPDRAVISSVLFSSGYEMSGFIQQAINACPVGETVLLAEGTFICNDHILLNKRVTLRGAGPGKTFLVKTNGAKPNSYQPEEAEPIIIIGSSRWPTLDETTSVNIAGAAGDTFVLVENATGLAAGQFVFIDRDDYAAAEWIALPPRNGEPTPVKIWASDQVVFNKHSPSELPEDPFPASLSWFSRSGRPVNEIKEISGVQGNTVWFTTPLHTDYSEDKSAQLTRWTAPHVKGAGLEDLTVSGGSDGNVRFNAAAYCWAKNVENTAWLGKGFSLNGSFRCEVRDSYIHDCVHPYPGGGGYGIELAWCSSEILIENNIIVGANKVMVVESAGAGSVVGYNYMDNAFIGNKHEWVEVGVNASHMVGSHHVLFEGNQSCNYDSDDTHGSSFAMTIFRNHLVGKRRDYPNTQNARCAGLMFGSWWHSFIGNVLGEEGQMSGWTYDEWNPAAGVGSVWKLGYAPALWNYAIFQDADPKVLSTVLRDGNWDYLTNAVHWDRPPQTIPDSLYLTSKPAFFGDMVWPWVEPDYTPKTHTLPARARYEAMQHG